VEIYYKRIAQARNPPFPHHIVIAHSDTDISLAVVVNDLFEVESIGKNARFVEHWNGKTFV